MRTYFSKFILIAGFILPAAFAFPNGGKKCNVRTEHGPGLEVFEENCVGGGSWSGVVNLPDFPEPQQFLKGPMEALEHLTKEIPSISGNLLETLTPEIFNEARPEPEILDPLRLFEHAMPNPFDLLRNLEDHSVPTPCDSQDSEDCGEIQIVHLPKIQPRIHISDDLEKKTEEAEEKLEEVEQDLESLEKETSNKLERLEALERL